MDFWLTVAAYLLAAFCCVGMLLVVWLPKMDEHSEKAMPSDDERQGIEQTDAVEGLERAGDL